MPHSMSAAGCNRMRDSRWAGGSYFQQLCAFICSFKPNFLKDRQRKVQIISNDLRHTVGSWHLLC